MSAHKQSVLILDSDEATRELYRRELGHSFTVLTAADERSAWRQVETETVDSVILEPATLEDAAWSFIVRLRALERHRETPIVVCSTLDERKRGVELGITTYLIKPVTPHLLSRALQAALQGKPARSGAEPIDINSSR